MKQETKKNWLIVGLIAAVVILILLNIKQCSNYNVEKGRNNETADARKNGTIDNRNPAGITVAKDGTTWATKKEIQSNEISNTVNPKTQAYITNVLLPTIKATEKDLKEFDRVKAVLSGEVPATTIQVSDNKAVKIEYKNKYLSIVTELDENGNPIPAKYKYNAEIIRAKVEPEKKVYLFGEKEVIKTVWTSPDKEFTIDSVQSYVQKEDAIKNAFILRTKIGANVMQSGSNGKFGVEALFNPDGFFFPSFEIGKMVNLKDGSGTFYGSINANINLVKIKKNK